MSNHKKIKLKKAPELDQKTKDSLQGEAWKYGKAFYSPKHKVNVDPEDGVLSNRVFYKDGTELKYDAIDKPFSESNINMNSSPLDFGGLVGGFQNTLGGGNAALMGALRTARSRKRRGRGMSSGFQDQIMSKLDAIANSVGNNASNAAPAQPQQPAQPAQMPGNPGPAPYDKDPIQDLATNMVPPAAAGPDIQAAEDMFGTPLDRQKSVSKLYYRKNK